MVVVVVVVAGYGESGFGGKAFIPTVKGLHTIHAALCRASHKPAAKHLNGR